MVSRWTLETLVLELASEGRVDADKMTAIVGFFSRSSENPNGIVSRITKLKPSHIGTILPYKISIISIRTKASKADSQRRLR